MYLHFFREKKNGSQFFIRKKTKISTKLKLTLFFINAFSLSLFRPSVLILYTIIGQRIRNKNYLREEAIIWQKAKETKKKTYSERFFINFRNFF